MFRSFFLDRRWMLWSVLGSAAILYVTWYKVQLDVRINEWFGDFYDTIQKALGNPGAVERVVCALAASDAIVLRGVFTHRNLGSARVGRRVVRVSSDRGTASALVEHAITESSVSAVRVGLALGVLRRWSRRRRLGSRRRYL